MLELMVLLLILSVFLVFVVWWLRGKRRNHGPLGSQRAEEQMVTPFQEEESLNIPKSRNDVAIAEHEIIKPVIRYQQQFVEASGGRRFANYLIDHFVFVFTISMLLAVPSVLFVQQPNPELVIDTPTNTLAIPRNPQLLLQCIFFLVLFLYYFLTEALFQRTPAKFLTGTIVVNAEDGSKPSIGQITGRTLIRFIPFELLIGFFSQYGWWHDCWTGTQVVKIEPRFSKLQRLLLGVLVVILYFAFFAAIVFIIFIATPETDQYPGSIRAEATGSNTRIAGDWVKEEPYTYDSAEIVFSFYMRDMQGEVRQIQAFMPQPECFEHNTGIIVEGYANNESFIAETLLLKLPTDLAC